MSTCVSEAVLNEFHEHVARLKEASRSRKESVKFKSVVDDVEERETVSEADTLGVRQPSDVYEGDVNLRTLRSLLKIIDDRGWERSAHQLQFHSAFERCVSRVLYKSEWATQRPAIMRHNNWDKCSSEVMISTPRRFGKTFRFIRVVDCEERICEFNQEACRINAYNGKKSLIRSFPSKVGVRRCAASNPG